MVYKKRGNKRRSKSAWRHDYKYYDPSDKWERGKKVKKRHKKKVKSMT